LLERGMDARPFDTELWLSGGQFIAYVAAPWLENPKEQAEWRLAGAKRMARACELFGSNDNIPFQCISAARIFAQAGERDARIDFLERAYAWSEDEEFRDMVEKYLESAKQERELEHRKIRGDEIRAAWHADLGFASATKELVIGPGFDPARCAGGSDGVDCATTWAAWRERTETQMR
jgi:hypothetical protein